MPLSVLPNLPKASDFTPLEQHQSHTPSSFFSGPPVLHAHVRDCSLACQDDEIENCEQLQQIWATNAPSQSNGAAAGQHRRTRTGVEILVTSETLIIATSEKALSIPYPAISLHAIQRVYRDAESAATPTYSPSAAADASKPQTELSALYLQIDPSHDVRSQENPDGDDGAVTGTLDLLVIPSSRSSTALGTETPSTNGDTPQTPNKAQVQQIFDALSACADLWPDENEDEEEDGMQAVMGGGGMPGEGGWITAENAHEYEHMFADPEGEEDGAVSTGARAGTRRAREDGPEGGDEDGEDAQGEGETKWQRTD